jgi:RNA recognition motif-containing protein
VKKLKKTIDDAKLNLYFSQFGELTNAYVIYDSENKRSRGYGIVQFASPETADAIMANPDKHFLDNKQVFLSKFVSGENKKFQNLGTANPEGPLPPNPTSGPGPHQSYDASFTHSNHGMASPENAYNQQQYLYEGQYLNNSGANLNPNSYGYEMSYQSDGQHYGRHPKQQFYQHTNPVYETYHYQDQPGTRSYYDTQPQDYRNHHGNYQNESQDNIPYYFPETYRENEFFYPPPQSRPASYQMQSHSQGDPTYQGHYMSENVQHMGNYGSQHAYNYSDNRKAETNPEQSQESPYENAQMNVSYNHSSRDRSVHNDQSIQFGQQQIWQADKVAFSGIYPSSPEQPPGQWALDHRPGYHPV